MMTILVGIVAIGQICIAGINMRLEKLLHWSDEIKNLSPLLREVFFVHKWFISITLVIFGVLSLRFAPEIARGESDLARWLAGGIGIFWTIRTPIQWLYYDSSHWRGKPGLTLIHWILTISYGGCAAVYLVAAFL